MNDNLPETPLGKRLLEEAAQRSPAPSGLWERVEQKRSKKTFPRHLFALVLATSIAVARFALLPPRTAPSDWRVRNQAVTVGGLFPDEARALVSTWRTSYVELVSTWRTSYVEHEGLRVLFILPQSWTETFISMQVLPKSDQLVRVMVGRIEGLTVEREAQVAEAVLGFAAHPDVHFATLMAQGRYLEPLLRRLAIRPELRASCEKWPATEFVQTGKGTAAALHKQLTL